MIDFSALFFFLSILAMSAAVVICWGILHGFTFKFGKIKIELLTGRTQIITSELKHDYGDNQKEDDDCAYRSNKGVSEE